MPTKALAAVGLLSCVLLLAPSAWAIKPVAKISGVTAQQRYPWNGKVDISYTASSVESAAHAAGFVPTLKVTAVDRSTTPWTTNFAAAAALSGDTSLANGTHALVWDLDAQGLSLKSTNVVFSVSSETNDFLVVDLSAGPSATRYPVESFDKAPENGWNQAVYKTSKLVLRRIPAGSVVTNTSNQARIVIDKPYYCGIFPVTGIQYTNVVASAADPSGKTGGMAPVEKVLWNTIMGAGGFISNLVAKAGIGFDLPTEEQWEYACRAGTSTTYNYGDTADGDYMWCAANATTTHEVGTASGEAAAGGNAWGLYDMHGNVREWTLTLFNSQGLRVVRGGGWRNGADLCTSSYRSYESPDRANSSIGFRLIRTLPTAASGGTSSAVGAAPLCTGAADAVRVDLTSGTRTAQATETIVYSPFWAAESGGQPSVTVCVNETGQALVTGSTGSGTYAWTTPTVPGTYTLQHETWQDYTLKGTLTATFEVLAEVTVADVTGATYAAYTNDAPATVPFVVSAETPIKVVYTLTDETKMFPGGYKTFETNLTANAAAITVTLAADQQPVAAKACADCLTFAGDAAFGIKMWKNGTPAEPNLEYSQDQIYWSKFDLGNGAVAGADNKLYLRGTGNTQFSTGLGNYYAFTNTTESAAAAIACSGNIMTLLDYKTVAKGQEPTMGKNAFKLLFYSFAALRTAPALPATNLTEGCYTFMFKNCASLTTAPALPATKPVTACYSDMFSCCTSLTAAPALPATNLAEECYKNMFQDCTSLTAAPELSAMNLTKNCYMGMFQRCTSLTDVPALPATNLAYRCYSAMFNGCTALEVNTNGAGKAWSIPSDAAASAETVTQWNTAMFKETAGDITNTVVTPGVTYYVKSAIKRVTVVVPEVDGATAQLHAFNVNGGWKAVETNAVPSNATVRVVWTADDGKALTGEGAANAYQWQTAFGPVVGGEIAPTPTVGEAGASEVTIALDTRAKKSYFDAKDILPVWAAQGAEVKVKGEDEQSWTTLVKSSATTNTLNWKPTAQDTYTLSHPMFENATIIFSLPVEVTTNDLAVAGTAVVVTDDGGQPLVAETEGEFAGKLIVPSNSVITVMWTATEKGTYFADGSTTYSQKFKAGQSVNPASAAVEAPEAPKAPSVKLGVVAQRYPWDGKLDVEYWAKNTPNDAYQIKVTVTLPDDTAASQSTDALNGKNTAVFDAKKAFGEVTFGKGVKVTAELVEETR